MNKLNGWMHTHTMKLVLMSFLIPNICFSSILREASIHGQAAQSLKDGNISACGIDFMAAEKESPATSSASLGFMGSVIAFPIVGLVKGYSVSVSKTSYKQTPIEMQSFWIKIPGHKATKPIPEFPLEKSSLPGSLMYGIDLSSEAIPILYAAITNQTIQIGFKNKKNKSESVIYGTVNISDSDKNQLTACVSELFKATDSDNKRAK